MKQSSIAQVLSRLKGTDEAEILLEVESVYANIEEQQAAWLARSKFGCIAGCGHCCEHFEPDLLESEALYMAAWLIEHQPSVAQDVAEGRFPYDVAGRCPFFDPESEYHCSIYGGRAAICRLFGASSIRNKSGKHCWCPCRFYPSEELLSHEPELEHRQYEEEEILSEFGAMPPTMTDMMSQLISAMPDEMDSEMLRERLPRAVQKLLWLMDLESHDDAS